MPSTAIAGPASLSADQIRPVSASLLAGPLTGISYEATGVQAERAATGGNSRFNVLSVDAVHMLGRLAIDDRLFEVERRHVKASSAFGKLYMKTRLTYRGNRPSSVTVCTMYSSLSTLIIRRSTKSTSP